MLKEIFVLCDASGDNKVNKRELIRACRASPEVSGFFGLSQNIRQEDGSREKMEELFQAMDGDDDREISWEEFKEYYQKAFGILDGSVGRKDLTTPKVVPRPLLMVCLVPHEGRLDDAAAIHIVRNKQEIPYEHRRIAQNPRHHNVAGQSHFDGAKKYAVATEIGAVIRANPDGRGYVVIPSLENKWDEGRYSLRFYCSEEITVERVV